MSTPNTTVSSGTITTPPPSPVSAPSSPAATPPTRISPVSSTVFTFSPSWLPQSSPALAPQDSAPAPPPPSPAGWKESLHDRSSPRDSRHARDKRFDERVHLGLRFRSHARSRPQE